MHTLGTRYMSVNSSQDTDQPASFTWPEEASTFFVAWLPLALDGFQRETGPEGPGSTAEMLKDAAKGHGAVLGNGTITYFGPTAAPPPRDITHDIDEHGSRIPHIFYPKEEADGGQIAGVDVHLFLVDRFGFYFVHVAGGSDDARANAARIIYSTLTSDQKDLLSDSLLHKDAMLPFEQQEGQSQNDRIIQFLHEVLITPKEVGTRLFEPQSEELTEAYKIRFEKLSYRFYSRLTPLKTIRDAADGIVTSIGFKEIPDTDAQQLLLQDNVEEAAMVRFLRVAVSADYLGKIAEQIRSLREALLHKLVFMTSYRHETSEDSEFHAQERIERGVEQYLVMQPGFTRIDGALRVAYYAKIGNANEREVVADAEMIDRMSYYHVWSTSISHLRRKLEALQSVLQLFLEKKSYNELENLERQASSATDDSEVQSILLGKDQPLLSDQDRELLTGVAVFLSSIICSIGVANILPVPLQWLILAWQNEENLTTWQEFSTKTGVIVFIVLLWYLFFWWRPKSENLPIGLNWANRWAKNTFDTESHPLGVDKVEFRSRHALALESQSRIEHDGTTHDDFTGYVSRFLKMEIVTRLPTNEHGAGLVDVTLDSPVSQVLKRRTPRVEVARIDPDTRRVTLRYRAEVDLIEELDKRREMLTDKVTERRKHSSVDIEALFGDLRRRYGSWEATLRKALMQSHDGASTEEHSKATVSCLVVYTFQLKQESVGKPGGRASTKKDRCFVPYKDLVRVYFTYPNWACPSENRTESDRDQFRDELRRNMRSAVYELFIRDLQWSTQEARNSSPVSVGQSSE